jgi:hypothetical protein
MSARHRPARANPEQLRHQAKDILCQLSHADSAAQAELIENRPDLRWPEAAVSQAGRARRSQAG